MKITTIGEILLDMTQTHVENGIPHFAANPGGAPANVAVVGAKLGVETAFIGCVGTTCSVNCSGIPLSAAAYPPPACR